VYTSCVLGFRLALLMIFRLLIKKKKKKKFFEQYWQSSKPKSVAYWALQSHELVSSKS
jgi:uncharacterized membrane protein YwzB